MKHEATTSIPVTVVIQRRDRGNPETSVASCIRWGPALHKSDGVLYSWALILDSLAETSGAVPYVRKGPESRWGIRVDILARN